MTKGSRAIFVHAQYDCAWCVENNYFITGLNSSAASSSSVVAVLNKSQWSLAGTSPDSGYCICQPADSLCQTLLAKLRSSVNIGVVEFTKHWRSELKHSQSACGACPAITGVTQQ